MGASSLDSLESLSMRSTGGQPFQRTAGNAPAHALSPLHRRGEAHRRGIGLTRRPVAATRRPYSQPLQESCGSGILQAAMHSGHHLGQIITMRQLMGLWPPPGGTITW